MPHFEGKITPQGRTANAEFGVRWSKKRYTKLAGGKIGPLGKKRRRR